MGKKYNIAVIPGDGIGPEIVTEAQKVLNKVAEKYGHEMNYTQVLQPLLVDVVHGACAVHPDVFQVQAHA